MQIGLNLNSVECLHLALLGDYFIRLLIFDRSWQVTQEIIAFILYESSWVFLNFVKFLRMQKKTRWGTGFVV